MDFNGTKESDPWDERPPHPEYDDFVADGGGRELGPFEKWDLVAWPKNYYGPQDMTDVMDQSRRPHLGGEPMVVGYVRVVDSRRLYVEEAEPMIGGGVQRDPVHLDPTRMYPEYWDLKPVEKRDVMARKIREQNELYQEKKAERERRQRQARAWSDWADLPAWKRWVLYVTMSRQDWIDRRVQELKDDSA